MLTAVWLLRKCVTFLRKETQWTAEDRGHRVALSFLVSGIVVALPLYFTSSFAVG